MLHIDKLKVTGALLKRCSLDYSAVDSVLDSIKSQEEQLASDIAHHRLNKRMESVVTAIEEVEYVAYLASLLSSSQAVQELCQSMITRTGLTGLTVNELHSHLDHLYSHVWMKAKYREGLLLRVVVPREEGRTVDFTGLKSTFPQLHEAIMGAAELHLKERQETVKKNCWRVRIHCLPQLYTVRSAGG